MRKTSSKNFPWETPEDYFPFLKLFEALLTRGYELIKFFWWFIILGLRAVNNKLTQIIARILYKIILHVLCSVPIGMALFSLVRYNNLQNNFQYNNTSIIMRALMVLMMCKIRKFNVFFGEKFQFYFQLVIYAHFIMNAYINDDCMWTKKEKSTSNVCNCMAAKIPHSRKTT